jgi:uncharacterized protein (TIGR02145 family)
MKKSSARLHIVVLLLFLSGSLNLVFGQAPNFLSYQGVLRGANGIPISNSEVSLVFTIREGSISGVLLFQESHLITSNSYGIIQCQIGNGQNLTDFNLSQINFAVGRKYLQVGAYLDATYLDLGGNFLNSVPYALYANQVPLSISEFGDTLTIGKTSVLIPGISIANAPPIIAGCMNSQACNYNALANQDNQSCIIPGQFCDDGDYFTTDDIIDQYCQCHGLQGQGSFFQSGDGIYDIDGNYYSSVIINGQEWMRKNLAVSKYRNGDPISNLSNDMSWTNTTSGGFCVYNNDISNNQVYGKLYNWYAVEDARGLCPVGWRVPNEQDWASLINYLDPASQGGNIGLVGVGNAGGMMKSSGIFAESDGHWDFPNFAGTDSSGFNGLPAGIRLGSNGYFRELNSATAWWTSTPIEYDPSRIYSIRLYNYTSSVLRYAWWTKKEGLSVRCLKNEVQQNSVGCTDPTACNYSSSAISEDGSCKYLNSSCDDGLIQTINDQIAAQCQCQGYTDVNYIQQGQGVYDIDNNFYPSIIIGSQEWMQVNLRTTKYDNGDNIPIVTDSTSWAGQSMPAYCNYENSTIIPSEYGKLYNGYTVLDQRNVCPTGWRLPDNNDWQQLANFAGGLDLLDSKIKSTSRWITFSGGDDFNYIALPAGTRFSNGGFEGLYYNGQSGSFTGFWTMSPSVNGNANIFMLSGYADSGHFSILSPKRGFSIRCIKI